MRVGGGLAGQGAADLVAVDAGQVAVEHDHVVAVQVQLGQGVGAVVADVDGHPLVPQAAGDGGGQHGLVLDDQHPHAAPPWAPAWPGQPAQGGVMPA